MPYYLFTTCLLRLLIFVYSCMVLLSEKYNLFSFYFTRKSTELNLFFEEDLAKSHTGIHKKANRKK